MRRTLPLVLLVAWGVVLATAAQSCASGVGRADDGDGGPGDSATTADVSVVDAADYQDAEPGPDTGAQPDSSVPPDSGPVCDPDPMPATIGDDCANAIDLGTLSDANADVLVVTGNANPAGREIWWSFTAADDVDTAGDEFHVDLRFINNPSTAYQMDVYRGGCDPANLLGSAETFNVDWYTDFATTSTGCSGQAPCGEGDCVPPPGGLGINACNDDTAVFYVRVQRIDGNLSCEGFHLEVSNGYY